MSVTNPPSTFRNPIEQTQDGTLEAPEQIITSVQGAQGLYWTTRTNALPRIELYASIEGLLAGNPPYDPVELEQLKLNIANFNTLDARGVYEKAAAAYWNLINQAEHLVDFEIRVDSTVPAGAEIVDYAQVMSQHFTEVLREWPSFDTRFNYLTSQLVKFGISPVVWHDEDDWRFRTIDLSRFFVPDQSQADLELLTYVFVESEFTLQYLFETYNMLVRDGNPEDSPWNKDALEELILLYAQGWASARGIQERDWANPLELQRRIQDGDANWAQIYSDSVRLVTMLQVEYDEKVSQYMFSKNFTTENFVYSVKNAYDSMQDAFILFTASPGEKTIHSNLGTGHKLFSLSQAIMGIDCSIVDMAKWSSTPIVQGPPGVASDVEAIQFFPGVPTFIGTGEFVQNQLGANITQLVGASQYLDRKLQVNIANSGDNPGFPDANAGSIAPDQAKMMVLREFGVLKNNISHFYRGMDRLYQNIVKRMYYAKEGSPAYKYVEEWKRRCLADGVPELVFNQTSDSKKDVLTGLPRMLRVKATRVAGDGSMLAKVMGLQTMSSLLGGNIGGPREQYQYKKDVITATLGPEALPAYLPPRGQEDAKAGGASLAAVENAVMQTGKSPVFSVDNEQRAHMLTHLALGTQIIEGIQAQQLDIVEADSQFNVLIPHMEQHYNALAQNPFDEAFVAGIKDPFNQIRKYAELNRKNAMAALKARQKKLMEQQQKQQQVMSEEERKNFVAAADVERKNVESAAKMQRAEKESDNRAQIMREKVREDAATDRLKANLDAGTDRQKAADEMSLEEIKAYREKINQNTPAPNDIESNTED